MSLIKILEFFYIDILSSTCIIISNLFYIKIIKFKHKCNEREQYVLSQFIESQ